MLHRSPSNCTQYHWAKYSNLVSRDVVFTFIEGEKKKTEKLFTLLGKQ